MRLNFNDIRFLLFFIPVFFLKLNDYVASDGILIVMSILSLAILLLLLIKDKIEIKSILVFFIMLLYTAVLVLICGKQGAFFSAVTIFALQNVDPKKCIYKFCFWVAVLALLVFMYRVGDGTITVRYINGEWQEIYKRTNILYVSFIAVVSLYIMNKQKVKWIDILAISVIGYAMYKYVGSRTGFLCLIFLVLFLVIIKIPLIVKQVWFEKICIVSPVLCFFSIYVASCLYGKNSIISELDSYMQGRLRLGNAYLERYDIKLFGQVLYENGSDPSNFWILDSAYLDMLLAYGLVFLVLWLWITCKVIKQLYNRRRYAEMAVVIMYAVYGMTEGFLTNCYLNVSMLLYGEFFNDLFGIKIKRKDIIKVDRCSGFDGE